VTGKQLLEKALQHRDTHGTRAAAVWLEERGINRDLAILALLGSAKAARQFGINTSLG